MQPHADVLEVIAEYACGNVNDACALRAANKGYRRAVDTTVRRLVYEDQPELRDAEAPAPLHLHRDERHLDAVCIAFSCDPFAKAVRFIAVAFALDGPKDAAHDDDCGPRAIATSQSSFRTLLPARDKRAPASLRHGLQACMSVAHVDGENVSMFADATPWVRVVSVYWATIPESDFDEDLDGVACDPNDSARKLAGLLRVGGPRCLTRLQVDLGEAMDTVIVDVVCPAIAACTQLTAFSMTSTRVAASTPLCNAIIASGSRLESISASLTAQDSLRLVEAVPSITAAELPQLDVASLPPSARSRLQRLNRQPLALGTQQARKIVQASDWKPSPFVTLLNVMADRASEDVDAPNIAGLFPNLQELRIHNADAVDFDSACFPPTLQHIVLRAPVTIKNPNPATAMIKQLRRHGEAGLLPKLSAVEIDVWGGEIPTDIAPLTVFAATLTTLVVRHSPYQHAPQSTPMEPTAPSVLGAVSQLSALVTLSLVGLSTTRCLLGGAHTRLRGLCIGGSIHDPDGEAPFAALARACPRLIRASTNCAALPDDFEPPTGWEVAHVGIPLLVQRSSFTH